MSDVKATTPFAKFLGLSLRRNGAKAAGGASKRADDDKKPNPDADDEDEDERKNASVVGEDDENDKPGSKGRRAQEPDDDAEDDQDDVDAEDEDDEAGAEDDGDDDKDPKARKAAKAERTRAGKIIAHGIDKGCVEAASVLAFTTGMSSASAIRVLDQQAAANMRAARGANGLYGRMNAAQLPNPGRCKSWQADVCCAAHHCCRKTPPGRSGLIEGLRFNHHRRDRKCL